MKYTEQQFRNKKKKNQEQQRADLYLQAPAL